MEDIAERPQPLHETADIAKPLYAALDWNRSYVGGSYALQQYTRNWQWSPGDIDVTVQCRSHEDFVNQVQRVVAALHKDTRIEKLTLYTDEMRRTPVSGREERFHEAIAATCTLRVPAIPIPVQLVGIELVSSNAQGMPVDLLAQLNRITDLPACVTYTVRDHERIFQVPERCIEALTTRRVRAWDVCASRRAKYAARGYTFVEE